MMRFEEIVEKLYENYVKAVEKEEKIRRVREIAMGLGFDINEADIVFDSAREVAYTDIEVNNDRLNEILEWLLDGFVISEVKLHIRVGDDLERGRINDTTKERAEAIGLVYLGYKELDNEIYVDYFEISENIYLLVQNYNPESN